MRDPKIFLFMASLIQSKKITLLLFFFALIFYARGLNWHGLEYRDDEIFYYKSSQEMLMRHNFLSPTYFGEDRFQKPILFYWLIMLSYQIFGLNWFGARIVAVIFASLSVCLTWSLARIFFKWRVALLSCMILMTFPLFFRHAKNVVPDMPLNFFIVLALWAGLQHARDPDKRCWSCVFFMTCALGFMIKGFAALVVPLGTLILFLVFSKQVYRLKKLNITRGLFVMAIIILPWFIYMIFRHGQDYTQFMLVHETQSRLYEQGVAHPIFKLIATFKNNALFYLSILGIYFAPWSLFGLGAVPLAVQRIVKRHSDRDGLMFMLIWLMVVFIVFSFILVKMSHYLLVLSTPFAVLLSYFLIEAVSLNFWLRRILLGVLIFLFISGFLAVSFIFVFLGDLNLLWLGFYLIAGFILTFVIVRSRDPLVAPLIASIFMIYVLSQTTVLAHSGLSPHNTWQRLAKTIHAHMGENSLVCVASHDLHEKEFQPYFDIEIIKTGHGYELLTYRNLMQLLDAHPDVYGLITETDFMKYAEDLDTYPIEIIGEDYMFRKRLRLDLGFVKAILHLDKRSIHGYLMERIVLFHKTGETKKME